MPQSNRPPPPPYYHATDSERSPLLNGADPTSTHEDSTRSFSYEHDTKRARHISLKKVVAWIFTILTLATLSGFLGVVIDHAQDSAARDQIRRNWALEQHQHVHEVQRWIKDQNERQANETKRIEKFKRDEQEFIERREQMNDDYRHEEQELIRRRDQMNREYSQREDELRRRIEGFEEELERKTEWEKRERERARVYWDDIRGAEHCLSNSRKQYSARLENLPESIDAMEACKATPVTINGICYTTPMHCENRGRLGGVYGHWIVENEGLCAAYWELVKEKDCTAPQSGLRRIEAKLGVVHAGEDPEMLCLTTPLTINGQTYEHPMACPDWGEHGFWGIWNIPDNNCG